MTPVQVAAKLLATREGRQGLKTLAMVAAGALLVIVAVGNAWFSTISAGEQIPGYAVPVDPTLPAGMPPAAYEFWPMYRDAARAYDVSPFLLMAVHEDETGFSHSRAPGVTTGVNFAGCCAGPMQFLILGGATPEVGGTGGTWAGSVRTGGAGQPVRYVRLEDAFQKAAIERPRAYTGRIESPHPNVYDSFDSIYAAALYLSYMGAGPELDERTYQALLHYKGTPPASEPFARADYNRAKQYAGIYAENGGEFDAGGPPTGETVMAQRPDGFLVHTRDGVEPNVDEWLAPVPGFPGELCDRRIIPNLLYLIRRYRLTVTDCYSTNGVHRQSGEHPIGLAADLVPAPNGSWDLVGELAAWAEPVQNHPRAPFRWVGYNGDPDHGDPAHTDNAHLHLSWNHAPTPWNYPAEWVTVWR